MILYQIRVNYSLFGGDKAEGKGQTGALVRTEERKDFRQKGGYQGGFGITSNKPSAFRLLPPRMSSGAFCPLPPRMSSGAFCLLPSAFCLLL